MPATKASPKLVIPFDEERETKNTVRFMEVERDKPIIDRIYLKKEAVESLGNPAKLVITVEPAK